MVSSRLYSRVIPNYTERLELNAGLKMFVRAHLHLIFKEAGILLTALNRLVRDFEGTPNSGVSVRPTSGLTLVVPSGLTRSLFRAVRSATPTIVFRIRVWYECQPARRERSAAVGIYPPTSQSARASSHPTHLFSYRLEEFGFQGFTSSTVMRQNSDKGRIIQNCHRGQYSDEF